MAYFFEHCLHVGSSDSKLAKVDSFDWIVRVCSLLLIQVPLVDGALGAGRQNTIGILQGALLAFGIQTVVKFFDLFMRGFNLFVIFGLSFVAKPYARPLDG